ncbi:MAG: exodeoxyribonuclease III [Gammaproteobacteria bacterium]|nr:exodeoxyribonuclease III [Gammaproteobacteria bacterium]
MSKKSLTIASWNVNSLPVRAPQAIAWFEEHAIDILAVQETKVNDDKFPSNLFEDLGLHVAYSGQKSYNGVALISRFPLDDVYIEPSEVAQRRIIAATVQGVRIVNLYVPNGSHLGSDKYLYKLSWLAEVTAMLEKEIQQHPKLVVVGDFNIAPEDIDVHDPKEWVDCVLCSPEERTALANIQDLGLHDSFRHMNPSTQTFSWWDYRAAGFRRNRGLRIDLILLSTALNNACLDTGIDALPRQAERPSDHAPAWVTLEMT